jgi:DNA repair protein RecN (Recombination protein N)
MLTQLSIKNYALIEESLVNFDSGFSVITGETGAGKSILLGALSLLLGSRADRSVLRDVQQKCIVEGIFQFDQNQMNRLKQIDGVELQKINTLRREVSADGKSRAFVNDSLVNVQVLKEVSLRLVNLNLQKENIRFLNTESQIDALDAFAQNQEERQNYLDSYRNWKSIELELKKQKAELLRRNKEKEFNQFRLEELDLAVINDENELQNLETEYKKLDQSSEILRFLSELEQGFQGDFSNLIYALNQNGQKFKELGEEFGDISNRLNSVYLEIKELAQDSSRLQSQVEMDPKRLEVIELRISLLYKLLKKYQVDTLGELIAQREEIRASLESNENLEIQIETLEKELLQSQQKLEHSAEKLTWSRKSVIEEMEQKIQAIFPLVYLPHAELKIRMESLSEFSEGNNGKDVVNFWFNANPGMQLQPLDQIASGGELSRITLVIKTIISEKEEMPTLIFDEIDSGISGDAALRVAELLAMLSQKGQVIAITHLPQIAAKANSHLQVKKKVIANNTQTFIEKVDGENRINALIEMLGGNNDALAAKKYVTQLLNTSKN